MIRARHVRVAAAMAAAVACGRPDAGPATVARDQGEPPPAVSLQDVTLRDYDFGGDFTLTDQNGHPFRLSGERGRSC